MAIPVAFKNPRTGEIKTVKVGWSWVLFSFSACFGIPLFLRRLPLWGSAMAAANVSLMFLGQMRGGASGAAYMLVLLAQFAAIIYLGSKGNQLTAKNYLDHGWQFADPNSDIARYAQMSWGLNASASPDEQYSAANSRVEPTWDDRR